MAGAPLPGSDPVPFGGGLVGTYRFHSTSDVGDWVWPGGYALLVPGCPGDCNNNGKVATTEIGILTRIALGTARVDERRRHPSMGPVLMLVFVEAADETL